MVTYACFECVHTDKNTIWLLPLDSTMSYTWGISKIYLEIVVLQRGSQSISIRLAAVTTEAHTGF